eukprot:3953094-Pleurochrysis_carterae.AAC.1
MPRFHGAEPEGAAAARVTAGADTAGGVRITANAAANNAAASVVTAASASTSAPAAAAAAISVAAKSCGIGTTASASALPHTAPRRRTWNSAEDEAICRLVALHGLDFAAVAAALPGRSQDAVRNRWGRLKGTGRLPSELRGSSYKCALCGQPKRGHLCPSAREQIDDGPASYDGTNDEGACEVMRASVE